MDEWKKIGEELAEMSDILEVAAMDVGESVDMSKAVLGVVEEVSRIAKRAKALKEGLPHG